MPSWGRSFGARNGKRRGLQERRLLQLEDDTRFEVVDSNEDEGHSNLFDTAFTGDGLHLVEGVSATHQQAHSTYYDRHASYLSEGINSAMNNSSGGIRQLAYRDKEDQLVQIAMDRIRRAQALGERNVSLTRPELDALERKRRKNNSSSSSSSSSRRNTALPERSSTPSKMNQRGFVAVESRSSKRRAMPNESGYGHSGPSIQGNSTSQGVPASPRHENKEDFPPGYFGAPHAESYDLSMQLRTRPASSHSPAHQTPPLTTTRPRDHQKRYFSVPKGFGSSPAAETPTLSRRLPDDPQWIPRARSASSNQPYVTGDVPQTVYTPLNLNAASSRPKARRSVFENYQTPSSDWGRDTHPLLAGMTPQQPAFSQFEGSDAPTSILSYANDSGDDGYEDYSTELDYVPHHELNLPRAQFDGYPRR